MGEQMEVSKSGDDVKLSTRERIKLQAREQLKHGDKPSQNSIRKALDTGASNTTITEALREFWNEIGQELTNVDSIPGIPKELVSSFQDVWKQASKMADSQVQERFEHAKEIERQAREAAAIARKESVDLKVQIKELIAEENKAQALLAQEQRSKEELSTLITEYQRANSELTQRLQDALERNDEIRRTSDQRYDRLMVQLEKLQAQYASEVAELKERATPRKES